MDVVSDNTSQLAQNEPNKGSLSSFPVLSFEDSRRAVGALQETKSSRNSMRALRKLNGRRKQMVQDFMEEFETHPLIYADYGSDAWINSMIKHFKDPPKTRILPHDVRNWLANASYFQGLNERYDYNPPRPEEPTSCPEPEISVSHEEEVTTVDPPEPEGPTHAVLGEALVEPKLFEDPIAVLPLPQMDVKEGSELLSPEAEIREIEPPASSSTPPPFSGATTVYVHQPVVGASGDPEVGQDFMRYMHQLLATSSPVGVPMLSFYSATPVLLHCYALSAENIINDLRNAGCTSPALEACQSAVNALKQFILSFSDSNAEMEID